jgi:hypothetical protein
MDNVSLNFTRSEPLFEARAKIPGRQENHPAAQSRFREISRLAIGKKEKISSTHFRSLKEMHAPQKM